MSDSVPPVKLVIGFPKICNPILDLYKNGIEDGVGNCPKVLHIRPSIFFNNKEKWKSSILKYINN